MYFIVAVSFKSISAPNSQIALANPRVFALSSVSPDVGPDFRTKIKQPRARVAVIGLAATLI